MCGDRENRTRAGLVFALFTRTAAGRQGPYLMVQPEVVHQRGELLLSHALDAELWVRVLRTRNPQRAPVSTV